MKNFKLLLVVMLVMVGLLLVPIKAKAGFLYPSVSYSEKETDSEGRSVYTYNLKLNITDTTQINQLKGALALTNLEVVSFTANPEFVSEFNSTTNTYTMTSNRYFEASDSGFVFATVVVRQIDKTKECNFGVVPESTTKVNVNEFTITKEAYKDGRVITEVKPNDEFQYKIKVTSNNNVMETDEVVVTDVVQSGLVIVSVDNNGTVSGNTVTWNLGTFPAGSKEVTLTITVRASEALEEIYNSATLEVNDRNFSDDNTLKVNDSDLSISKTVSQTSIQAGTEFYYTIVVQNNGTSRVSDIKVEDVVDSNLEIVNVNSSGALNGNTVTWTFSLEPGAKKELVLNVRAKKDINVTSIKNSATLTYDDKTTDSNITEVTVTPSEVVIPEGTNDPTLPANPNTGTTFNMAILGSVGIVSGLVFKKAKNKKKRIYSIR